MRPFIDCLARIAIIRVQYDLRPGWRIDLQHAKSQSRLLQFGEPPPESLGNRHFRAFSSSAEVQVQPGHVERAGMIGHCRQFPVDRVDRRAAGHKTSEEKVDARSGRLRR